MDNIENIDQNFEDATKLYAITLADGTTIDGLRLNGTNYVSEEQIDESIFAGNLSTLTISDGEETTVLHNAELIQQVHYPDANPPGWYLCFREKTARELLDEAFSQALRTGAANLDYLSMMTGVDLPNEGGANNA